MKLGLLCQYPEALRDSAWPQPEGDEAWTPVPPPLGGPVLAEAPLPPLAAEVRFIL